MANKKIKVLDPTSKAESKELQVQRRPIDLEGKVLGIVWNRKLGGDVFLDRLAQLLMERFQIFEFIENRNDNGDVGWGSRFRGIERGWIHGDCYRTII